MNWVTRFIKGNGSSAKGNGKKRRRGEPDHRKSTSPYRAVTIYCKSLAPCGAVQKLEGKTFLATAAPSLPLTGCSKPDKCSCRYRYHDDRRREVRRDADVGLPGRGPVTEERRKRRDRRSPV